MIFKFSTDEQHIDNLICELIIKNETWYLILANKKPKVSNNLFINKITYVYKKPDKQGHGDNNIRIF